MVLFMSPEQCRMARAALKWSTIKLAEAASVSTTTVNNFENGKDSYTSTAAKLEAALLASGKIEFNGDCCVCLKAYSPQ